MKGRTEKCEKEKGGDGSEDIRGSHRWFVGTRKLRGCDVMVTITLGGSSSVELRGVIVKFRAS